MGKSYKEEFKEWFEKQPRYQDVSAGVRNCALILSNCWLNNDRAFFNYARLDGKKTAKVIAVQFCWDMKNKYIKQLEEKLKQISPGETDEKKR